MTKPIEDEMLGWRDRAMSLWKLLDDISTARDECSPDITRYFFKVNALLEKRNDYLISNGRDLFDPKDTQFRNPITHPTKVTIGRPK